MLLLQAGLSLREAWPLPWTGDGDSKQGAWLEGGHPGILNSSDSSDKTKFLAE